MDVPRIPLPSGELIPRRTARRGFALIIALALVLAFTMIVASTQVVVTQQLRHSRFERDYDRALQMAEAGINAYLNRLSNGTDTGPNAALQPPIDVYPNGFDFSLPSFKANVDNGTFPVIRYPTGQNAQGYFVRHTGAVSPGALVTVVSYGYSNGVTRRVKVTGLSFNLFDWAAIWGLNPGTTNQDYAWKFTGSAKVIGGCGAEGRFVVSNAQTPPEIYYGPLIWAKNSFAVFPTDNTLQPVYICAENYPEFHYAQNGHTHGRINPYHRVLVRGLDFPTADQAANEYSGSTLGVDYFMNNNHNATGFRLLAKNSSTGVIRELPTNGTWSIPTTGPQAYELNWPSSSDYTAAGIDTVNEVGWGLRVYPGHYYLQGISQTNNNRLFLRTFSDAERTAGLPRSPMIENDPANPNSGQAGNKDVRFWIGRRSSGNDPAVGFDVGTEMEYSRYASRFRVYSASRSTVSVQGRGLTQGQPPPPFRVNLLAYNRDSSGNGYGGVAFNSSVYLFGSLISWKVDVSGGTIIEKEATEGGGVNDRLSYVVIDWTELQ